MRKLNSYTFLSLNGYYKDLNEDTSWHQHGEEEAKFSETSLEAENTLLFGRTTYEMMNSFWPSPMAAEMFPKVAQGMNNAKKIVFSNTLKEAEWENTSIVSGNIIEQITKLKQTEGSDMTILGSGSIIAQFSDAGLIDTYQIMIDPVALPSGQTFFNGIKTTLNLKLIDSKVFSSGVILLTYEKQ